MSVGVHAKNGSVQGSECECASCASRRRANERWALNASNDSSLSSRFWSKVRKGDGCWLWHGALSEDGYGRLTLGASTVGAHRIAWFLGSGVWPDDSVMHHCDTPPCVRFDHLAHVSHAENMADRDRKRRNAMGTAVSSRGLTAAEAEAIRAAYASGVRAAVLAIQYNLSRTEIWRIAKGHVWKINARLSGQANTRSEDR